MIAGCFPYQPRPGGVFEPMPAAPPFSMLPSDIQELFVRCFVAGHEAPAERPTAAEWQKALNGASKNLVVCPKNEHHHYSSHLGSECPWCKRISQGLPDPFPKDVPRPPAPRRKPRVTVAPESAAPAPTATVPGEESRINIKFMLGLAILVITILMRMCG